jgi:protoporphyrinogen oxidase
VSINVDITVELVATPPGDSGHGPHRNVAVIEAGRGGLTAAYVLVTRYGVRSTIIEADAVVGGISRTVECDGWRFDIGGHRFFTKVKELEAPWHEILPDEDFMSRLRMSRIFYEGNYYDYPLKVGNTARNLGPVEASRCVLSYLYAQARSPKSEMAREGWVVGPFGWCLCRHFFECYTERLWGVPVRNMPADFAAQRIKSLSLFNAATDGLLPNRNQKRITPLSEEFHYPTYGPGIMWERCSELIQAQGCAALMNTQAVNVDDAYHEEVTSLRGDPGRPSAGTGRVAPGYCPQLVRR